MPRGRAPAIAELGPTWKEHPLGLVVRQPRYHVPIKFSLPISLQRWPSFFPCQSGPWWWRASLDLRWTVQRPSWTWHWSTPQPRTAWPTSCSITGSGPPRSWRYPGHLRWTCLHQSSSQLWARTVPGQHVGTAALALLGREEPQPSFVPSTSCGETCSGRKSSLSSWPTSCRRL